MKRSLDSRCLFIQTVGVCVVFALYNCFMVALSRNTFPQRLLRAISTAPHCDTIILGNSLMASGFALKEYEAESARLSTHPVILRAALGATTPLEHLLILRAAVRHQAHFDTLIYGYFDTQLSDRNPPVCGGNRVISYYVDPNAVAQYYPGTLFDRFSTLVLARIPYTSQHITVWGHVEVLRRKIARFGMPSSHLPGFGLVQNANDLEDGGKKTTADRCLAALGSPNLLSPEAADFVRLARISANRVIFVKMPMPSTHIKDVYTNPAWTTYQSQLVRYLDRNGVQHIDASQWILNDDEFADAIHLSTVGAGTFSSRLADTVANTVHQTNDTQGTLPFKQ